MHIWEENELLEKEMASYETNFVSIEGEKHKFEAVNQRLQKEEYFISQHNEVAAKWEAEKQQLFKERNFIDVEKIQA